MEPRRQKRGHRDDALGDGRTGIHRPWFQERDVPETEEWGIVWSESEDWSSSGVVEPVPAERSGGWELGSRWQCSREFHPRRDDRAIVLAGKIAIEECARIC
jgi:hypothetical protein